MLNLLRFREVADYRDHLELAPAVAISGAEAFERYIRHTLPLLRQSGGELLYLGNAQAWLIGPESERWDQIMLVRQSSVEAFLGFASHAGYLEWRHAAAGHPGGSASWVGDWYKAGSARCK